MRERLYQMLAPSAQPTEQLTSSIQRVYHLAAYLTDENKGNVDLTPPKAVARLDIRAQEGDAAASQALAEIVPQVLAYCETHAGCNPSIDAVDALRVSADLPELLYAALPLDHPFFREIEQQPL